MESYQPVPQTAPTSQGYHATSVVPPTYGTPLVPGPVVRLDAEFLQSERDHGLLIILIGLVILGMGIFLCTYAFSRGWIVVWSFLCVVGLAVAYLGSLRRGRADKLEFQLRANV